MSKKKVLKSIVHGAGIVLMSYVFAYVLAFFYRILIARSLGPSEYGTIMLAVAVLGIGRSISLLGLTNGVKRYIGFYTGKKDDKKVKGTIVSSLKMIIPVSLFISVILYFLSEWIALNLFHSEQLVPILKIFVFIIPLNALVELFKAIFLSFKKAAYASVLEVIGEKFFNLAFAAVAIVLGAHLYGVTVAYILAYILTAVIGFLLLETKVYNIIKNRVKAEYRYRELLVFSLPLLLTGVLSLVLSWGDTFLLGFFANEETVGLYNVGFALGYSLLMVLGSFEAIYTPISSNLLAQKKMKQLTDTYNSISRWIFLSLWPLFLVILFFSEDIIRILFGYDYVSSWKVLVIVSIGFFVMSVLGPVYSMLQTFDKTYFIFKMHAFMAVVNVLMNILLIPLLGMEGAAISTSFLWSALGIIAFLKLRGLLQISFEVKYYAKYIVGGLVAISSAVFSARVIFGNMNVTQGIITMLIFGIIYGILLIVMRSFSKDDIMIMSAIEKRLGLDLRFLKNIIKRFN
jgi:O-antigen/teichoic acid export membrane protein